MQLKMPEGFSQYLIGVVNRLPEIINASAIPILIFLAGLQSIPLSLYEASKIEGATAWENFWKITFPIMSPLLLSNIVYIIVYSFTAPENKLVKLIMDTTWMGGSAGYGLGGGHVLAVFSVNRRHPGNSYGDYVKKSILYEVIPSR